MSKVHDVTEQARYTTLLSISPSVSFKAYTKCADAH